MLSILLGRKKMTTLQQLLVLDQIFPRGQQFEYGIHRNGGGLAAIVMSLINDELSARGELSDFMRERCVEIFKFVVSPSTSTYTSTSASTSVAPFLDSLTNVIRYSNPTQHAAFLISINEITRSLLKVSRAKR